MSNSPASIAFSGPPIALNTTGGVTIFEVNQSAMIALALMAIFLVVRHTRGEEEEGRTELLRSAVVGRHGPTVAALLVVGGASAVVGVGVAGALISLDLPVGGSIAYGVSLALLGLAFTAVGACAAQVTSNGRAAIGLSLVALAVSFVLRAVGDVGTGVLSWLTPMGWMQAVRPYADERWWAMLPLVGFTGLCWVSPPSSPATVTSAPAWFSRVRDGASPRRDWARLQAWPFGFSAGRSWPGR